MWSFIAASRKIYCTFKYVTLTKFQRLRNQRYYTCSIDEKIDSEDYYLASSEAGISVERFEMENNNAVKFLPRRVGEKFPTLKFYGVKNCGLTIVREYSFHGMRRLNELTVEDNEIGTIEAGAFDSLINVNLLGLRNNLLETIDQALFTKMINLEHINLSGNRIKFLRPKTFQKPGKPLIFVFLNSNVCINGDYSVNEFQTHNLKFAKLDQLESDIIAHCSRS